MKGIVINNQLYCEILKLRKTDKKLNDINIIKDKYFYFMNSIYVSSISSIYNKNEKILFSIYLNSLKDKNNKNVNIYEDSNKMTITLKKQLDSNKDYFFTDLFYEPKNKIIIFVENLSNYEEINSSLTINSDVFKINQKDNRIFKGKVIKASFSENKIKVKIIDKKNKEKIVDIQLNHKLIKDITFNGINYFINFNTENDNKYSYKKFSHIIIEEKKTFIEIDFLDYINKKNKYDSLKINEIVIKIISDKLRIELTPVPEQNYFREKLIY